jgi:hypothetical protein
VPPKKIIPEKRKRAYRAEALQRLHEKREDFNPSSEPIVTPLLKAAEGGLPRILEALRAHDNDDAREFVELYDSLSQKDRQHLTLEEIAHASGIGSLRLAEIVTSAMILHGQMTSKLILASALSGIVRTSVRLAKTAKGGFDREMMLKAGGVVPVPKGSQISINNVQESPEKEEKKEAEHSWIEAGERLRLISDAVDPKRLPSPPSEPIDLTGRLQHMQDDTVEALREV